MKNQSNRRQHQAFTLIEMLVVIAIIGMLAALIFPVGAAFKKNAIISRTKAELAQLETALDSYKQKQGFYPPADTNNPMVNPLYFELFGSTLKNQTYVTLDGSAQIAAIDIPLVFGANVQGFVNSGATKNTEEGTAVQKFLPTGLKPGQIGDLTPTVNSTPKVIISPTPGPVMVTNTSIPKAYNPWRYVATNPTNNPSSYDLWIDLSISGKNYRISNWRKDPQTF